MNKDNTHAFKSLTVIAICIAIVGLSMGYAALDQVLDITSEAVVGAKSGNWNIKFINPSEGQGVGTAEVGAISLNSTDVTVSGIKLKAPGDTVTYTFDVVNEGSIDAKLSTFTMKEPTITGAGDSKATDESLVSGNYLYTVTYADGSEIAAEDTLMADETKHLKLVITYGTRATELPINEVTISGLGSTFVYVQN